MAIIQVTIPGRQAFPAEAGLSVAEALKQFGVAGDHDVVAARVNGNLVDLNACLLDDSTIAPFPGISRGLGHRPPRRRPHHG